MGAWDESWMMVISVGLGTLILPFLIYRLTPPEDGHAPWIIVLGLSWGVPLFVYLVF